MIKKAIFIFVFVSAIREQLCSQPARHVVLISIDGFRPEMYLNPCSPPAEGGSWPAPNLQWLMKEGMYAKHMRSVFPSYTYPSHTAMLTGALPARSGIVHNVKDDKGDWYWFTKDVKVPTLWQALKKNGMTSASVEWPVSVGPDITYDIPEIWNPENPYDRITEARNYADPSLLKEIEENATGKLDSTNMRDECFCLDENAGRIAAYLFKKYKPNLLCVHFAEVDGMEHEFGRYADSVRLAVGNADRSIGDILEAIKESGEQENTTVIVVGDHGFSDIHTLLRPNMLTGDLPARFKSAGGSAFLYATASLNQPECNRLINSVKQRCALLPTEQRKLFRIIDRNELDKMGADSAALLALSAVPGVVFSAAVPANVGPGTSIQQNNLQGFMSSTHGGHHGYDPGLKEMYTGFIACGAGIDKGNVIDDLCVTDIAPLIAKLLGIQFNCADGKPVKGILK